MSILHSMKINWLGTQDKQEPLSGMIRPVIEMIRFINVLTFVHNLYGFHCCKLCEKGYLSLS